jgi:hypothetical protein
MKKYFIQEANGQSGPFDFEELKKRNILKNTPVWYEGLAEWTTAEKVEELKPLFQSASPPPFEKNQSSPPRFEAKTESTIPKSDVVLETKSKTGLVVTLVVLFFVVIGAVMVMNNPNSVPGVKLEINTPKPVVVTSRADGKGSGLFNARTTVYATVLNEGGDGNVLVNFYVYQGEKKYSRSKSIYLSASQSQDLEETFEEVDYVSGDIKYDVATDIH